MVLLVVEAHCPQLEVLQAVLEAAAVPVLEVLDLLQPELVQVLEVVLVRVL